VIDKLDRILLRDMLRERREQEFRDLVGAEKAERGRARLRLMLTLRSGARRTRSLGAPRDKRQRRRRVWLARRSGEAACGRLLSDVEERGGTVLRSLWLTHSVVVEVPHGALAPLVARRDVASASHVKSALVTHLDKSRPLIQADQVESAGITGAGVDVAILDTGVDFGHAALAGTTGSQQDFSGEGVGDFFGHGTHCAGIVVSQDKRFRGVAPGAVLHDYKWLNQFGGTGGDVATGAALAVSVIQQAVTDGMDVLSNSWGFTHADDFWVDPDGTCVLCTAADQAAAMGVVFVVSAGNEDNDSCSSYDSHIACPANARDAITVGASDDSDAMADFSSIGPTPDGRAKPDVVAPGVDIVSLRSSTGSDMGGGGTPVDTTFLEASGTSMSCPHVAGVCALLLERNPRLTPAQIKGAIMATAVDIGADPMTEMGSGRVDALAAVNSV
jgi:serine protease AprX